MATNLLKFFSIGSDGVAFLVGASGIGCACRHGIYLVRRECFWQWAVYGLGKGLLGLSISSFQLPSSVSIREVSSFFSHGQTVAPMSEGQNFLPGLLVAVVDTAPPPWFHFGTLLLDFLFLDDHAARQALKWGNVGKDENIGFDGYIGTWILRIYRDISMDIFT